MSNFKPMLATSVEKLSDVILPTLASVKLDGVRCEYAISPRTGRSIAQSRQMLPIPNRYIRKVIESANIPTGLSGELTLEDVDNYHDVESAVMSCDGTPQFYWNLFDFPGLTGIARCETRYAALMKLELPARFRVIPKHHIKTLEELVAFEESTCAAGFEGIVCNNPLAFYHYGRSNLTVQHCVRFTRRIRKEAVVIEFIELQRNCNPLETSALGYSKRSKSQANLRSGNTLGAIRCRDCETGIEFEVGSFQITKKEMQDLWDNKNNYPGRIFTYEYKPYGVKDKPRQPVFVHWRNML